jgi:hypothetical protein
MHEEKNQVEGTRIETDDRKEAGIDAQDRLHHQHNEEERPGVMTQNQPQAQVHAGEVDHSPKAIAHNGCKAELIGEPHGQRIVDIPVQAV